MLDMNKVVANSVTLLRPLIGEDIELTVRLPQFSVCVRADHYQMEQILMNLAVNARRRDARRRQAPPGDGGAGNGRGRQAVSRRDRGAMPRRSFRGPSSGPWVVLRVQDSGVGMSEDTRSHIFEPFFTTKDEGKGSGLGLSTVYGIVSQSGGRVRVESALGRGTVFTVCPSPRAAHGGARRNGRRAPDAAHAGAARSCSSRTRPTSGSWRAGCWRRPATR